MDPKDKKQTIQGLIYLTALVFPCFAVGILMIGGSIHYLDCNRVSASVSCVITTRFLGTFTTERRLASGVTDAVEVEDCGEDDCRYRIELVTASGAEPLSVDYSIQSKAADVNRINAYLVDSGRQAFHTTVINWPFFIVSAVLILIGGAGLYWVSHLWIEALRAKTEWQPVLLGRKTDAAVSTDRLFSQAEPGPQPQTLRIERDIARLRVRYRHPAQKGLIWLLVGGAMFVGGWISADPIYFWIFAPVGLLMIYVGIVTMVNQWIIQVTYDALLVRYAPLPFYHRRRRIPAWEIKQLYVEPRTVYKQWGDQTYHVLEAVLQDNRRVSLISELPYEILRYIEVQIESWLKLEDRWVVGEAIPEVTENAKEKEGQHE